MVDNPEDREVTVTLSVYECRALRIASIFGGPPQDDPDKRLLTARRKLQDAEAAGLREPV